MNSLDFKGTILDLESTIEIINSKLDDEQKFSYKLRVKFNIALNDFLKALNQDNTQNNLGQVWHILPEFVKLRKVHSKIEQIKERVLEICPKPYFQDKITNEILPALEERTTALRLIIFSQNRLPFAEGFRRAEFHMEVKEILAMQNQEEILRIAKEFFHLIGDRLNRKKLKEIDTEAYTGSLEIYSLESWLVILKEFMSEVTSDEKIVGEQLTSVMQKSLNFALKTSFAFEIYSSLNKNEDSELNYLEDLVTIHYPNAKFFFPDIKTEDFLDKYQLMENSAIPKTVIINELAWDMLEAILKMKQGEMWIFPCGIKTHAMLIQMICLRAPTESGGAEYQYKIFNTGYGINQFHQMNENKQSVYPLIFDNVKQESFSYSFFSELLRMLFEEEEVSNFYQLHYKMLTKDEKNDHQQRTDNSYLRQNYGLCSYASLEAWIRSLLTPQQSKHFELVKTRIAVQKQTQLVKYFESEINHKKALSKNTPPDPSITTIKNLLKENKLLLQLGKKYLKKVIKKNNSFLQE